MYKYIYPNTYIYMYKVNKGKQFLGYRVTQCPIVKINFNQAVRNASNFIQLYKMRVKNEVDFLSGKEACLLF